MGPGLQGTFTPIHADVLRSYSWSTNITGRKLWQLLPPEHTHLLYDRFGRYLAPGVFAGMTGPSLLQLIELHTIPQTVNQLTSQPCDACQSPTTQADAGHPATYQVTGEVLVTMLAGLLTPPPPPDPSQHERRCTCYTQAAANMQRVLAAFASQRPKSS